MYILEVVIRQPLFLYIDMYYIEVSLIYYIARLYYEEMRVWVVKKRREV